MTGSITPAASNLPPTFAPPATATGTAPVAATLPNNAALLSALTALITTLTAVVDALKGAQLSGGGPTKGGGATQGGGAPAQSAFQSPLQSPLQGPPAFVQGGGAATPPATLPTAPALPPVTGGGPTAATAPQPATPDYTGPTVGIAAKPGEQTSFVFRSGLSDGGTQAGMQIFGRYGSPNISSGYGQNTATLSGQGIGVRRVAIPDSGSAALSSGATVTWTANILSNPRFPEMKYNELTFTVTRPGSAPIVINAAADRAEGYQDGLISPLSNVETAELARALTAYPLAQD